MSGRSWSKWSKHKVLRKHPELAPVLPETHWMTESSFSTLLAKYRKIVAKPIMKWGGQGVTFISKLGDRKYRVQAERTNRVFSDKRAAWEYVNKIKKSKNYIVQEYVPLAKANGHPFDIRVMVQRKKKVPWTVTGKLAKIAGSGYQITNAMRSNGSVATLSTALKMSSETLWRDKERIDADIDDAALLIAKRLGEAYPMLHTIGLDLGLDKEGNVWFIEANFTPMVSLFRKLKNKEMYLRILSFRRK